MTVEAFIPHEPQIVQGIGPYSTSWPVLDPADVVVVIFRLDGSVIVLEDGDYSVAQSAAGTDVFLSVAAAQQHAGHLVYLTRQTFLEQGWAALSNARELGLGMQLDRIVKGLQDHADMLRGAVRTVAHALIPVRPKPDAVFGLDDDLQLKLFDIGSFPEGPRGPRGLQGPRGPRGPRGFDGPKGDPGNVLQFGLDGVVESFALLPDPVASNLQTWGVIGEGFTTIYYAFEGVWHNLGSITTPEAFPVANTIYVQENGSNANSGTSLATAVRHIERALELAELRGEPTLIEWYPDAAVETQGHLDMPDDCCIISKHRTVFIRPSEGFEERNVFRMGSGCFIEGMMLEGWRVDSLTDPKEGFAASFRPGAVIRRVPYVHKIAVRNIPSWGLVPPPLDAANGNPFVPRGGGVVLADGSVCSQYSIFPNIMTWGATPVSPNGLGYVARKGGLINAVNAVSMWAHKHFTALEGGQCILSSCSTQFGDFTMHADGFREIVQPEPVAGALSIETAAATAVRDNEATIIDAMWNALVAGSYTTGWTGSDEEFTRKDAGYFIDAVAWLLDSADPTPVRSFIYGLFDTMGERVFSPDKLDAFVFSFEHMRDTINGLGISANAQAMVTAAVAAINGTLTDPAKTKEVSRITAIGHTWTANMAGVALTKIPPVNISAPIQDSILETNEGVVIATGQDDFGNALLARGPNGTLEVDAQLGLTGSLFTDAVRRQALQTSILGSYNQ